MRGTLFRYGEQQLTNEKEHCNLVREKKQKRNNCKRQITATALFLLSVCLSVCLSVYSIRSFCLPVLLCLRCCCSFVGEYCADGGLLFCMSFYWFEMRLNPRKNSFSFWFKCLSFPRNRCSETPLNCSFWCCGVLFLVKATTWFG